uniref:SSD domain-containing protein n=1 Tax=Chromera velia CCMP2878 TaxID=1169474 RepID=A0A0G4G3I9_9ALVE|mmetsp:Transcript_49723/g.97981  ORF Transcript_49723/g.97981 Transcript_49723/m.97981 type:complete len:1353 (+) Transcript_49723:114-4172(+)|eukprot:Cvel_4137.t1-p1 / transcript=Cvel_4137.t1 / gene=Cvel_4137 / organism=Chromera_velia_CCMP2878 / gene_product=Patched domain-containing protein 3, putative / transcript_product=Patched domain-containing protein 3, putative / location=Cvel_scaffold177:50048-57356(-) / protein_length=1352 / sequence_SO=supercontig / SO=protein_coding / is_pseudo=false
MTEGGCGAAKQPLGRCLGNVCSAVGRARRRMHAAAMNFFKHVGYAAYDYPVLMIGVSFFVCAVLSVGILYAQVDYAWTEVYAPTESPTRDDMILSREYFGEQFEYLAVLVNAKNGMSVTDAMVLDEIDRLDDTIRSLRVRDPATNATFRYSDVCRMQGDGACDYSVLPKLYREIRRPGMPLDSKYAEKFGDPVVNFPGHCFEAWSWAADKGYKTTRQLKPVDSLFSNALCARVNVRTGEELTDRVPCKEFNEETKSDEEPTSAVDECVAQVAAREAVRVVSAKGTMLFYRLQGGDGIPYEGDPSDPTGPFALRNATRAEVMGWLWGVEQGELKSDEWAEHPYISVTAYSTRSYDDAMKDSTIFKEEDFIRYSIITVIMCVYAVGVQFSSRLHEWKVIPSLAGCLATLLAYGGGTGLLYLCGLRHTGANMAVPFLVLGIGVDDFFVILGLYHLTAADNRTLRRQREGLLAVRPRERLGLCMSEAGMSISLTTATDILGLAFGLGSPCYAIKNFCIFMIVSLFFGYVMCLTFFLGHLGIDARREVAGEIGFVKAITRLVSRNPFEPQSKRDKQDPELDPLHIRTKLLKETQKLSHEDAVAQAKVDIARVRSEGDDLDSSLLVQQQAFLQLAVEQAVRPWRWRHVTGLLIPKPPSSSSSGTSKKTATPDSSQVSSQHKEHNQPPVCTPRQASTESAMGKGEAAVRSDVRLPTAATTFPPLQEDGQLVRDESGSLSRSEPSNALSAAVAVVVQEDHQEGPVRSPPALPAVAICSPTGNRVEPVSAQGGVTSEEPSHRETPSYRCEVESVDEGTWLQVRSTQLGTTAAVRAEAAQSAVMLGKGSFAGACSRFVQNHYARFLLHPIGMALVLVLWAAYLVSASLYLPRLKLGLQPVELTNLSNPLRSFFKDYRAFKDTGYSGEVFFDEGAEWWRPETQDTLLELLETQREARYFKSARVPMEMFLQQAKSNAEENGEELPWLSATLDPGSKQREFEAALKSWLSEGNGRYFRHDFIWTDAEQMTGLRTWRYIMYDLHCDESDCIARAMLDAKKDLAKYNERGHFNARYYQEYYLLSELDLTILASTLLSMAGVLLSAVIVSVIVLKCFWAVTFVVSMVLSIDVGMLGFMVQQGLTLSLLSSIIIIICAGFAVDYVAHICHAFTSSLGVGRRQRAVEALAAMGPAVFHGAVTVMLAAVPAVFSDSNIFQIFFRMISMAIGFALLHGLVVLPVLLSLFGPKGRAPAMRPPGSGTSSSPNTQGGRNYDDTKRAKIEKSGKFPSAESDSSAGGGGECCHDGGDEEIAHEREQALQHLLIGLEEEGEKVVNLDSADLAERSCKASRTPALALPPHIFVGPLTG